MTTFIVVVLLIAAALALSAALAIALGDRLERRAAEDEAAVAEQRRRAQLRSFDDHAADAIAITGGMDWYEREREMGLGL